MLIGSPKYFAIESEITKVYSKPSLRALGFFVVHIEGRMYGVRQPDATLLANSFDSVGQRIEQRGQHKVPSASTASAQSIVEAFNTARHHEFAQDVSFLGVPLSQFEKEIYARDIMWAPDGDEAFDDGSYILQFDENDRVRLIAFVNQETVVDTVSTTSELWLAADKYYEVLSHWKSAFEAEWNGRISEAAPKGAE